MESLGVRMLIESSGEVFMRYGLVDVLSLNS